MAVAADYLDEGGFDDVARMVRGQTDAELWDSYVRAALQGANASKGSFGQSSSDVARYATDVADRCLEARRRKFPNR
jgi:hypothetical protein